MTLTEIRAYTRVLIDQPNTAIWSTTNLDLMINGAYRDVVSEILRRNPKYFHKSSTISSTASTPYTNLPSDCVIVNKIVNSEEETLPVMDLTQQNMDADHGEPTNIDITGPKVFWYPVPDAVYAFTIYYHYIPSDMTATSDTPVLPPGFHDIIAYGAAINSRMAKEEQLQEYMIRYEKKLQLLLHSIAVGQTNEAPRIHGAYNDFYLNN